MALSCEWITQAGSAGSALIGSVDDERLYVRIVFKYGVITGSDSGRIFDCPAQFKTDIVLALLANGEPLVLKQRGLMH